METMEALIQTPQTPNLTPGPTGPETQLSLTSTPPEGVLTPGEQRRYDEVATQSQAADEQERQDRRRFVGGRRQRLLSRRQRLVGALGLGAAMPVAAMSATACQPIEAIMGTNSVVKQHYIDNSGITRPEAPTERAEEGEAASDPEALGLQVHNGDLHVYENGITISRMAIYGCVGIHADSVVMHDVYIQSDHACTGGDHPDAFSIVSTGFHQDRPDGSGAHNFVIYDSEINGMNTTQDIAGIGQDEWKAFNVRIYGTVKGVRADHDNVLWHSAVYNLSSSAEHGEGVFIPGGPGDIVGGTANINIIGNYIESNASTGAIALLNIYDASGITIDGNVVNGRGGAGITGGSYKNKAGLFKNVVIKNNTIDDDSTPEGLAFNVSTTGNQWTNNKTEKGVVVNAPIPWKDSEPYNPADIPATP